MVLCLDAPFNGLDLIVTKHISSVLHKLAEANALCVVLSLRPQDTVPAWNTHVVYADENGKVNVIGTKEEVFGYLKTYYETIADSTSGKDISAKSIELRKVGYHLPESGNFEASNASGSTKVLS